MLVSSLTGLSASASFEEAVAHKDAMVLAVRTRAMPPWMPADGCQTYEGSRRLDQSEIDSLTAWVERGAAKGEPRDAPVPPVATSELPWPGRLRYLTRVITG